MSLRALLSASLLGFAVPASADILISQYYDGSSGNNKWIELVNTDASPVSLDGYVITSWSNASTEAWKTDGAVPGNAENLTGFSIPANGHFLIGNAAADVPAYAVADITSTVTFINGDDSVVLYNTAQGAVGDTVAIVDALAFTDAGNEGADTSIYRISNGVGFDTNPGSIFRDYPAVWAEKTELEVQDAATTDAWYLQSFVTTSTDELTISLAPTTIAENGGTGLVDVTVTRSGSTAAALAIELVSSDAGEAVIPLPDREIRAGRASETFAMAIDAVDDALADGTQTVTISATALGFRTGTAELSVTDDGDTAVLAINEILADPPSGAAGDSNRDGVTNSGEDEFVEVVNTSGADLDISFWELHDGAGLKHTFPIGTVLGPDCAVVVFGGGSVDFLGGSALYQLASNPDNGSLGLNNDGDTVTIFDEFLDPVASHTYGAEGGNNESLTRDPDVTGPFVGHGGAVGALGPFSPGTRVDGTQFCPALGDLSISLSAPDMIESGGSLTATITRTGDLGSELEIFVKIDDPGEAETTLVSDIEFIPAGQPSVEVTVNAVDDIAPDGTQTVTITATAVRYNSGSATFEVLDDGDGLFDNLVINEFHYDPATGISGDANGDGIRDSSDDEFVEILNVSGAPFDLGDYRIRDAVGVRHIFPIGTVLADGQAIVVFGGGSPTGGFGGSLVQLASTGFLGLNNGGDSVIFASPGGSELLRVDYDNSVQDESLTRDPDETGGFVAHSSVLGAGGALFSPGTRTDGSSFPGGSSGPAFSLERIAIDRTTNTVTVLVSGLVPNVTYDFESSDDLGYNDLWTFLQLFLTEDGTEVSPGVYEFVFSDASIATNPQQFYRVSLFQ